MHGKGRSNRRSGRNDFCRLSDYAQGQRGRIVQIQGDDQSRRRLSEMGFTRGIEVLVVKSAPLLDPIEYIVKGYHISLRRDLAAHVLMDPPNREASANE